MTAPQFKFSLLVPAYRSEEEQHPGGGVSRRTVQDGTLAGDVEVFIDMERLRHMAERALRSKSRKATLSHGLLVCKARDVRRAS